MRSQTLKTYYYKLELEKCYERYGDESVDMLEKEWTETVLESK